MKYSAPGGCIEVTLQQNEMFTKFQVRDHGLGIEAGRRIRSSEVLPGQAGDCQEGFGLGLYLARGDHPSPRRLCDSQADGTGTLIEVNLPL